MREPFGGDFDLGALQIAWRILAGVRFSLVTQGDIAGVTLITAEGRDPLPLSAANPQPAPRLTHALAQTHPVLHGAGAGDRDRTGSIVDEHGVPRRCRGRPHHRSSCCGLAHLSRGARDKHVYTADQLRGRTVALQKLTTTEYSSPGVVSRSGALRAPASVAPASASGHATPEATTALALSGAWYFPSSTDVSYRSAPAMPGRPWRAVPAVHPHRGARRPRRDEADRAGVSLCVESSRSRGRLWRCGRLGLVHRPVAQHREDHVAASTG